jgi:hypothetical protein
LDTAALEIPIESTEVVLKETSQLSNLVVPQTIENKKTQNHGTSRILWAGIGVVCTSFVVVGALLYMRKR